eukprot:6470492-Amphidinium_carterae.1
MRLWEPTSGVDPLQRSLCYSAGVAVRANIRRGPSATFPLLFYWSGCEGSEEKRWAEAVNQLRELAARSEQSAPKIIMQFCVAWQIAT